MRTLAAKKHSGPGHQQQIAEFPRSALSVPTLARRVRVKAHNLLDLPQRVVW